MGFSDETVVFAQGGKGGDGAVTFRREPYTPRGGPDGGDGGQGGSVVLEVSTGMRDLSWLADHPHQRARGGQPGGKSRSSGSAAADLVINVPDGTVVRDERGFVADLVGEGARAVVARGGRGGRGNAALASSRNRAPRQAEAGEPGEEHRLELELRIVADVGLVGLPNAGKSTLLSKLSAARPKIADYPFTTLTPNLGVAGEDERFVVADIPGLVEGASEGRGLGHQFLRHVSRCRVLLLVVDLSGDEPEADLATIRAELAAYDPALAGRPQVVVGTKADVAGQDAAVLGDDALTVSGVTGEGIDELHARVSSAVDGARVGEPEAQPYVVLRPARERFVVRREGERFRVVGRDVERWVAAADLDDPRSVTALQRLLVKEGVERKLASAGARRGDEIVIGDRAFEFFPEDEPPPAGDA
ncbi:MAG TPA: GTPase ObgE [Actinomycetota bacterium]|nr:GTPase ObgE [Actinomycetota bacterium]